MFTELQIPIVVTSMRNGHACEEHAECGNETCGYCVCPPHINIWRCTKQIRQHLPMNCPIPGGMWVSYSLLYALLLRRLWSIVLKLWHTDKVLQNLQRVELIENVSFFYFFELDYFPGDLDVILNYNNWRRPQWSVQRSSTSSPEDVLFLEI
jgi:hypothetical protein